ncbi:transmembrane protein, putative (macronuclear) [Tetrahymena thermophila SB210]|uniref:Transmembrane protein, putative n=1 Tax=Tetrahymena thermophila (strain SB210) TaxID=312017 RepID=I7MAM2_TETTS|nr:transmembrane protein, putative [Tetrahymena thermophila SB210]EAS04867.2 transmembrane protein, putative [Tetrahymena thermophila SB210]|eukprot:XP_001025112.2 transmembrane protein, putative [Tetrahymena thermophila SB210]
MDQDKSMPLLEISETGKKKLNKCCKLNYSIAAIILCSSIAIFILNLVIKSQFQLRLVLGITQSAFGLLLALILIYLTYFRKVKLFLVHSVASATIGLIYDALILNVIVRYSKNDPNYSKAQIELSDIILGFVFTMIQTFSLFISIFLLVKMKRAYKLCKKFTYENFQVSLQEEQKSTTPVQTSLSKQNAFFSDKDQTSEERNDQKQQVDFFENCSQYTDSVISDIENSIPNKKKKALKSMDVLQNTDSDAQNQKSHTTKSDRNNSSSMAHQPAKQYLSLQQNDKIYEGEEEDEDESEYQVYNKILTPQNQNEYGFNENQNAREKSFSNPKNEKKKQKNTYESKSYYNTTIDLANS